VGDESVLNFGDASILSFHATKVFHTVEGGAIVFKRHEDYLKAKELINFGIKSGGHLGEPGINAKLNEYQCAVGLTLLDNIEEVLRHRADLFSQYRKELNDFVEMPQWHPRANENGAYMPIFIAGKDKQEAVLSALSENNIQFRRYFTPSLDTAYQHLRCFSAENSHRLTDGVICLPLHYFMTKEDVTLVTDTIKGVYNG
jgi:dTDP-4-amino-4,6-dideoxygalactose transaminase